MSPKTYNPNCTNRTIRATAILTINDIATEVTPDTSEEFVPNSLFLFCGRSVAKISGLLWEDNGFLLLFKRMESDHCLSEEELAETFPNEYKKFPHEVYRRLHIIPEILIVDEHHVHAYASKDNDGTIVKAPRPADLFRGNIAAASLVASIINGKYSNALPLKRQSRAYRNNGINLATNTLANWVINTDPCSPKQQFPFKIIVYTCFPKSCNGIY